MLTKAYVYDRAGFEAKMAEIANPFANNATPVEAGLKIIRANGCFSCHSIDGTAGTGPTWKDMFGNQIPLADGSVVTADENYIHESVYSPNAKVHKGFGPPSAMQSYQGKINEKQMGAIIAYMKSISANYKGPDPALIGGAAGPTTGPATSTAGPKNAAPAPAGTDAKH
jgi:cytochrome c oxidase subunit 2